MYKAGLWLVLGLLFIETGCNPHVDPYNNTHTQSVIDTLVVRDTILQQKTWLIEQDFEFDGRPINPRIIEAFTPWLSDYQASTLSIDVKAASGSNQYAFEFTDSNNLVRYVGQDNSSFSYRHLGQLTSGVHVVKTFKSGGGVGLFQDVLFFRFSNETIDIDGRIKNQLVLHLIKSYCLGDRTQVDIEVRENSVRIDAPCGKDESVTVNFK